MDHTTPEKKNSVVLSSTNRTPQSSSKKKKKYRSPKKKKKHSPSPAPPQFTIPDSSDDEAILESKVSTEKQADPTTLPTYCANCNQGVCTVKAYATQLYSLHMYAKDHLETANTVGRIRFLLYCGCASLMYPEKGEGLLVSLDPCVVHLLRYWYPDPDHRYKVDVVPIGPNVLQRCLGWIEKAGKSLLPLDVVDFDKDQWLVDVDRFKAAKKALRLAQKEFDEVKNKLDTGKAKKMAYEEAMNSIVGSAAKRNKDLIAHGQLILDGSSMAKRPAKAPSVAPKSTKARVSSKKPAPKRCKSWERDTSSDEE